MGHYYMYSLEFSKIDLLFVGGQVRSEADLMMLNFFVSAINMELAKVVLLFFFPN